MKIGTVLAFADDSIVSNTIEFFTHSNIAHVAVVTQRIGNDYLIVEAATFESGDHVGAMLLSERIKEYEVTKGNIWQLNLTPANQKIIADNRDLFRLFLYRLLNKDYDLFGAIGAGLDVINNNEDDKKLFCSELITMAFKYIGILPKNINSSEVTPIDLCSYKLYDRCMQICGTNQIIKNFNTVKV